MEKIKKFVCRHDLLCLFACITAMIFLRYLFCGFSYSYQLDDYIQYHNYPTAQSYSELIKSEGLFSSRPLAVILDLYVFAPLRSNMILGVLLVSIMYGASAVLYYKVFRRFFGTGLFFPVFYALLPLGFEGTYWISASSRIVTGLFFISVALWSFIKFTDGKSPVYAAMFVLFELLSFSVYEQIFILSFLVFALFFVLLIIKKCRRALVFLFSFSNAAIYFVFTSVFGTEGAMSARMELCLPTTAWFWNTQLPYAARQIGAAFLKGGFRTLFVGFYRGVKLIFTEKNFLYPLAAIALTAALFFICRKAGAETEKENKAKENRAAPYPKRLTALIALALAAIPAAAFLFIGNTWFSLRSTVPSFVGAALLFDTLLRLLCGKKKLPYQCAVTSAALVFIIAGASETFDYNRSYERDKTVVRALAETAENQDGRIGIINLNATYSGEQNYFYHEHIEGVTESEWSLHGALVCYLGKEPSAKLVPLAADVFPFYHGWNESIKRIDGFDGLYFWNEEEKRIYKLNMEIVYSAGENFTCELYFESGTLCATVTHENGYGYITISDFAE